MEKISVLIPCYNSEDIIRPCLESVRWADELLICDSFSTDQTLAICKEYTSSIIQHKYVNSADYKNWAIPKCKHEWVLIVDTDEVLEEGFREEIVERICSAPPQLVAYRIPRKNYVYGKWLRHGGFYPDYQIRLFRKSRGKYDAREVHEHMEIDGEVQTLRHHFLHNGFKDISTWFLKSERYLGFELQAYQREGVRFSLFKFLVYPFVTFAKTYFWKRGFLDGPRGFLVAVLQSFYHFIIFAKLWEKEYRDERR
jgi:glycosyltransferase involved in cell wall biosynthesis